MELLYYICFFLLGTIMGSFYQVVGTRIPKGESIVYPRSHCENCKHILKWYELIPLLSFLFLKGKCSSCKKRISLLYPFCELFCGLLFFISYYSFGFSYNLLISLVLVSLLIIVIVSDLTYMIIPDRFIVISVILLLLIKLIGFGLTSFLYSVLYGLIAFVFMYFLMLFGSFILKKEALGGADVKLMIIVGICVEPFVSLLVIVLASLIALPISLFLLVKNKQNIIPFGPFILIGLLITFFTKLNSYEILEFLLNL